MKSVGIRELKDRLSKYLRQVQAGETLLITDRGRVVAEIREPAFWNALADDSRSSHYVLWTLSTWRAPSRLESSCQTFPF